MYTYKLIKQLNYEILLRNDNTSIPFDPANVDFQQYQQWLSEGNVPEPADESTLS